MPIPSACGRDRCFERAEVTSMKTVFRPAIAATMMAAERLLTPKG